MSNVLYLTFRGTTYHYACAQTCDSIKCQFWDTVNKEIIIFFMNIAAVNLSLWHRKQQESTYAYMLWSVGTQTDSSESFS